MKALHLHEIYGNRVSGRMPTAASLNIRLPVQLNLQNSLAEIFFMGISAEHFLILELFSLGLTAVNIQC